MIRHSCQLVGLYTYQTILLKLTMFSILLIKNTSVKSSKPSVHVQPSSTSDDTSILQGMALLHCFSISFYMAKTAAAAMTAIETKDMEAMLRAPLLQVLDDDAVIWSTSLLPAKIASTVQLAMVDSTVFYTTKHRPCSESDSIRS